MNKGKLTIKKSVRVAETSSINRLSKIKVTAPIKDDSKMPPSSIFSN